MQSQPLEVGKDGIDMFRAAPGAVNILDPQDKPPACVARAVMRQNRRPGMAPVQPARGTRRKARDNHGC